MTQTIKSINLTGNVKRKYKRNMVGVDQRVEVQKLNIRKAPIKEKET